MFRSKKMKRTIASLVCVAVCMQQAVFAAQPEFTYVDGVKVNRDVKDLVLDEQGNFNGAIVDINGQPVAKAVVVIGQQTQPVALLKTDEQGSYSHPGLQPGIYQVASFAGVQTFRVWNAGTEPQSAAKGSIQVMDSKMLRGQSCDDCDSPGCGGCGSGGGGAGMLVGLLKNPLVWGVVIAAAIVLPLALDDDDDAS